MPAERPTILSQQHISRAINDPNFYTLMPEFAAVRKKMEAMHASEPDGGCDPCRKRRITGSLTSDFISIMNRLSDDGLQRIKKYVGVGRLLVRATNKQTGRMELREV